MIKVGESTFNDVRISNTSIVEGRTRREGIEIVLAGTTFEEVSGVFKNGVSIEKEVSFSNEETIHNRFLELRNKVDYSEYNILSDIIVKPNGIIVVYMVKKTDLEKYTERINELEEENAALLFENLTGEEF